MERMNEKRSANYLFIRKTISNIIARRFALESEIFSQQYGNTISIDINHQRRELNFIFRTPGKRQLWFPTTLNPPSHRWRSRGNRHPKPLRRWEVLRSNVPDCKPVGEHESSVQVNPSQILKSLLRFCSFGLFCNRALDEWDVFLDNINRKQISRTLLGFGLQKQDYQFIFIRLG